MPLEISEIAVQLAVRDGAGQGAGGSGGDGAGGVAGQEGGGSPCGDTPLSPTQMEEIVSRTVRRVMQALRMKEAR